MISWLNFEELLIHNPIELINFSKSNIQVALSKKQYIDFFSNKAVYMGLYYDEEMDFCVMFYADPLQSSKSGEMYAEGYIDVDMKIYRVKVLSNVSIKYPPNFNLLEGTKHFSGDWVNSGAWTNDGTYKGLSEATSVDFPKWNVTKTGMRVSPQSKQITMVQAGALMRCEINNNITGWTDGTTQLEYSGQDFIIDGYGMRGLHNG